MSEEPVWGACAVERREPPGWEGADRKTTPQRLSPAAGLCQPGLPGWLRLCMSLQICPNLLLRSQGWSSHLALWINILKLSIRGGPCSRSM